MNTYDQEIEKLYHPENFIDIDRDDGVDWFCIKCGEEATGDIRVEVGLACAECFSKIGVLRGNQQPTRPLQHP